MTTAAPADGTLSIDPPLTVAGAEAHTWDLSCDVLVVGYGAAGASAALAAQAAGANVVIAERFEGGGASTKSGGVVYAGGGTKQQKVHGYDDTPEQMFRYLRQETGDAVSEATLRKFCEDSKGMIEWLESIGADFTSPEKPPKTSYPRDGIYLYYSGNEVVPAYAAEATPAPRGHRTRGSWMSGKVLYELLRDQAQKQNIPVLRQCAARRLITDAKTGAVLGAELWQLEPGSAEAKQHAKLIEKAEKFHNVAQGYADKLRAKALTLELTHARRRSVRALRGVILTTGGFIFNRQMVHQHAQKYAQTMRLGATGCDGSGIRLGQSVGGVPARLNKVSAWRFINPPTFWPKGIVVDEQGKRFCNEQVYGAKLGVEMCESHQGRGWIILDKTVRRAAMKEALFGKLWFFQSVPAFFLMFFAPRAKTLEALGQKIGINSATLKQTVEQYTADTVAGRTDALGKSNDMRLPLKDAPFFAMNISSDSKTFPCPAITLGGLKVDERNGAVLNAEGRNIPGLYAAGRTAVGIASNFYVSGLSLADCLWSGRRAGEQAAIAKTAAQKAA